MCPWPVRQQRSLAKEAVGDNLTAEMAPFSSTTEGGGEEIREEPFVYVLYLMTRVVDTLNHHLQ